MSEYGVVGPPKKETSTTEANPRDINKWAQEVTHRPKYKVGGPTGGSADLTVGPTAFRFHVEVADWLLMSV